MKLEISDARSFSAANFKMITEGKDIEIVVTHSDIVEDWFLKT